MRSTMIKRTNIRDFPRGTTTVGGAFFKEGDARGRVGLEQDTSAAQAGDARAYDGDVEGLRRGGCRRGGGGGGGGR